MGNFVANDLNTLQGLPLFSKSVKGKLGTYNTRERYDSITHFDDKSENEYNVKCAFDEHKILSSFFNIISEENILTVGDEIIFSTSNNVNMDSNVSRQMSPESNIIARNVLDHSYKKKDGKLLGTTATEVHFCTVYDKHSDLSEPIALIKEVYKSETEEDYEDNFRKISSDIITFKPKKLDSAFYEGTESVILDKADIVGDYIQAYVNYAYTPWNELIRVRFKILNGSHDARQWIVPGMEVKALDNFVVHFHRPSEPKNIFSSEYYKIDDDSVVIEKIEKSNGTVIEFGDIDNHGMYPFVLKTTAGYNDYEVHGSINIPTSGQLFFVNDTNDKVMMDYTPYMDSTYASDPAGQYFYTKTKIDKVLIENEFYTEYEYDGYGVATHQWCYKGKNTKLDFCKYESTEIDGKLYIESLCRINPINHDDKGYFYKAVEVVDGIVTKDYRAMMIKSK